VTRSTLLVALGLLGTKLLTHLWLVERYGYHRDELYFIACGEHLAWGYVDHAPFVPWVARAAGLFGHSLLALRLPAIVAGCLTLLGTILLVRRWDGRAPAQLIAGLAVLSAPAFMRMSKILCIPAFEPLFWVAGAWLVTALLERRDRRLWLAIGALVGAGLMVKHTMLFWALGLAVATAVIPGLRADLRTRWPWLGAALAILIFSPNLAWQLENDWATLEFLQAIRSGTLDRIPRALFLGGQVLYMNPLAAPIWIIGLVALLRDSRPSRRVHAVVFLTALVALVLLKAKPYYLAPAYPVLHAAGGIWLAGRLEDRRWSLGAISATLAAAAAGAALVTLPILSLPSLNGIVAKVLGWAVPPVALTHDLHDEFGWPEQARAAAEVAATLSERERAHAVLLTGNYGQASAASFFGEGALPPAVSGHMSYHLWGPTTRPAEVALSYGLAREQLLGLYRDVREQGRIHHPLAAPGERELPVFVCRSPRRSLAEAWPELKRYGHGAPQER
jgi:4-amino-4-deoxy-L-arabinose transferase-like glycosyltransferase